jgi:hypothetical protein
LGECDTSLDLDGLCLRIQSYDLVHIRTQVDHVDVFFGRIISYLRSGRLVNTDLIRGVTPTDDFNEMSSRRP